MSNLGLYQTMTKAAKKVGGPLGLMIITAFGGYIVIRFGEAGTKKVVKTVKKYIRNKKEINSEYIVVAKQGKSNEGLSFAVGDKYRVLEKDGEAVLIEKFNDNNNPYFVSAEFLKSISNYK